MVARANKFVQSCRPRTVQKSQNLISGFRIQHSGLCILRFASFANPVSKSRSIAGRSSETIFAKFRFSDFAIFRFDDFGFRKSGISLISIEKRSRKQSPPPGVGARRRVHTKTPSLPAALPLRRFGLSRPTAPKSTMAAPCRRVRLYRPPRCRATEPRLCVGLDPSGYDPCCWAPTDGQPRLAKPTWILARR